MSEARGSTQPRCMTQRSPFRCFKTDPEIIRRAVMLPARFPLSLKNVENLLHERGIEVGHETVRFWWLRIGPILAAEIRKRGVGALRSSHWRWHLDEVFVKADGAQHYPWRAVDHEGEVLEAVVSKHRDRRAAHKFLKKPMKRHGRPAEVVAGKLRSHGAAPKEICAAGLQVTGVKLNNRAENSRPPFRRRKRAMPRVRRMHSLQTFASVHSSVTNHFNSDRSPFRPPDRQASPHRRSRRVAGALRRLTFRAPASTETGSRLFDGFTTPGSSPVPAVDASMRPV